MVPTPSIVISITSPGWSQTGGLRAKPTPAGVPVAMTSPGLRVVNEEKNSTLLGTSTSICEVRADCMTWPLSTVVSARSETSTSSGGDDLRADGHGAVEVLPRRPLAPGPLPVPHRRVVQDGEPGDRVERLAGRDVPPARADHDAELALVVERFGQGRLDQVVVRAEQRLVPADERVRPGRHRASALQGVVGVVQAEAEDPLGGRHRRAELRGQEVAAGVVLQSARRVQGGRAGGDERGERGEPLVAGRLADVDVSAAVGPYVQAGPAGGNKGGESHEPNLPSRVVSARLGPLARGDALTRLRPSV